MIPKKHHKYLAVSAIVAGAVIGLVGIVSGQYVLIYCLCGAFCVATGITYLLTVKETDR